MAWLPQFLITLSGEDRRLLKQIVDDASKRGDCQFSVGMPGPNNTVIVVPMVERLRQKASQQSLLLTAYEMGALIGILMDACHNRETVQLFDTVQAIIGRMFYGEGEPDATTRQS